MNLKDSKIRTLEAEFNSLNKKREELKPTAELNKLITEQEKLKYRINILKQVR
jgi:hypothetical protein